MYENKGTLKSEIQMKNCWNSHAEMQRLRARAALVIVVVGIYIPTYMYVCMYVYMYVRMYVWIYACTHVCTYEYVSQDSDNKRH